MIRGPWWSEPGMTGPDAIAKAARAAGVYRDRITAYYETGPGEDEEPAIIVEAHGGPWLIVPGPMGWWAVQGLRDGGGWWQIPDTAGWLGCGDLEPDRVVGNLLDSASLPTNWRQPDDRPVSTRRVPADEARRRIAKMVNA